MSTQISAAQAVGEYLQSPDDLLKIAAFRKKLAKEKASIDAKLKSGVKDQLEATSEGLRKLHGTRDNVQAIKDEMANIDRMCRDPANEVKTFDQISRVSVVHRNFARTEEMVSNLIAMDQSLDVLEQMLMAAREDILGPAEDLLRIHYQINQLETFRNETLHQAKKASADAVPTLKRYFGRLNAVISAFDDYITELGKNVLPIVRAGNSAVIVKLVKIAEIEGKEDQKATAIKVLKRAINMDAASRFKSMAANARVLKHYRMNLISNITASINEKFRLAYEENKNDPGAFLAGLDRWMYGDLLRIGSDVVPCFPQDYDIFSLYVKKYHKALDDTLKALVESEPEASLLLHLFEWLKEYKKNMRELEIPPELLEPPLLGGKEQSLIEDYVGLIIKKLDEWASNIMAKDTREFTARDNPPITDPDGWYGMDGPLDLFQMVNQQADAAADSGQGAVLARVVTESARVLRRTREQWMSLLDSEFKKQIESKPEEIQGGLVEYVMAVANDQVKCAEFAETLSGRLEPLVSEKYKVVISQELNEAIEGYVDVTNKCTDILVEIIFNDLRPAVKQLFGPTWYGGILQQIIETIRDYMADYQTFLRPAIFELTVEGLIDTFLITYLTALVNSSNQLRMPAATDRITEDVREAFNFFATFKPAGELEQNFDIMDMVLALLTASKSLVFLSFWNFAKVHGPNLPFVEALMKLRDDLDRAGVSEVMEAVKRKIKEENLGDPPEPTLMKKVTVQNAFSRFLNR